MNKQLRTKINKCQNLEEKVNTTLIFYVIFVAYLPRFLLFVYVVNFLSSLFVTAAYTQEHLVWEGSTVQKNYITEIYISNLSAFLIKVAFQMIRNLDTVVLIIVQHK